MWGSPVAPPQSWSATGLVMFFNLECPGCVSRGVPLLKRLAKERTLNTVMIHTAFGHKRYTRDEVVPTLQHFAETFARLSFPVALDLDGSLAESWQVLGTPHWLVFRGGELYRSVFGSQDNAQLRLGYALEELEQA